MKILLVDDHVLIREALRGVLLTLQADATIVEASDWQRALLRIAEHPDLELILLDLKLPDKDGFEALAELRERFPATGVVVLSGYHDRENVMKALDLGALGFIPKSAQREVMLSAFNLVFSGGTYIPPEILERRSVAVHGSAVSIAQPHAPPREPGLTARQSAVLTLMMQGKSNKAICRALDLAEPTVKNHVTAILKALNVTNRTEAVIAAGARGYGAKRGAEPGKP